MFPPDGAYILKRGRSAAAERGGFMRKPYGKEALLAAFVELLNEKPFDRISVVELTRRSGMSRNTFYYWYHDVYDLVDALFTAETQKILRDERPFGTWQEAFLHATKFAYDNRRAVYHLYNSVSRGKLEHFLYAVIRSDITAAVARQARGTGASARDIRDLSVFYSAALMGLVSLWLGDDMREDPDVFIGNVGRLLDGNIRTSLGRSREAAIAAD